MILRRGSVYLVKFNPSKDLEIAKVRPAVVLTAQVILNTEPPIVFVCPLSSQSRSAFSDLHIELTSRDALHVKSYALIEHARSVSVDRIVRAKIAKLSDI